MGNRNRSENGRASGARSHRSLARVFSKQVLSEQALFENALMDWGQDSRRSFDPRSDRKTLQLCRQVQQALMLALAGECADDLLREISVDAVMPGGGSGGAGHLLVSVYVPGTVPVLEVLARLNDRSAKLRAIVACSICRKRTPMLSFIAVPMSGGGCDE